MTITVNVTQDHIDKGREHDCHTCPVARALREAHPAKWWVGYGMEFGQVTAGIARGPGCLLPVEACRWVRAFDSKKPVSPFSFEFDCPEVPDA